MRYGAHLPLIDLDGRGWTAAGLTAYARSARRWGFDALAANDHLVFARPWLDGLVALSAVVEASGDLTLLTSAALPVVRGPVVLARAAASLDALSGGRLVLGLGPGSSADDYALVGADFDRRWPLFEDAVRTVRSEMGDRPPIWVASWGSEAGLRRVARLGDGWLASAYHATPADLARGRAVLAEHAGRPLDCAVATLWTWVSDDERAARAWTARLAALLGRPQDELADRVLIGSPDRCADLLGRYADAGVDLVLVWPVAAHEEQLERVMTEVVPRVR